jgi:hypothetical protein
MNVTQGKMAWIDEEHRGVALGGTTRGRLARGGRR